ncbi:MAG: DUF202 domain-containing protein [Myxococcota bacterium]|nr:DUF202 domain-containing protein [Myxococcota bacterium]
MSETETSGGREISPYRDVRPASLILRDHLAADRTVLANERTFLAYLRTAFAFAVGGATLVHFVDRGWAAAAGGAMIPLGGVLLAWGVHRFLTERRRLAPLRRAVARVPSERGGSA